MFTVAVFACCYGVLAAICFHTIYAHVAFVNTMSQKLAAQTFLQAERRLIGRPRRSKQPERIAILGGGSFGLSLGSVLAKKGHMVSMLMRNPTYTKEINEYHRHPVYLQNCTFPENMSASTDPEEVLHSATHIIHAVPVQSSRQFLLAVKPYMNRLENEIPILCVSKGIEIETLDLMHDVVKKTLGMDVPFAYLSGPSFAREICLGKPAAVCIASKQKGVAKSFQKLLRAKNFQVLTSSDVVGMEIAGALKNVVAVAAGLCEGLQLGTNALSALITTGLMEMKRLGTRLGGRSSTFFGLSGAGDMFGTCIGPLSRNRAVGVRLAKGESLDDILKSNKEVAEGVATARAVPNLIAKADQSYRRDLKYPVFLGIADIVNGRQTPTAALEQIMSNQLVNIVYT